ncbi:RrF2 family transcriptional regulator [Motilibacter aurantiacus]|uniref:RrF2 family transcriptional regulator n=1 Tax=Motilibacter aurantiacus TaxID=2714955 RepID=UPI00140D1497|nr:Rrf2 family transcriptional regulator [Motilibacter aurantiacus]
MDISAKADYAVRALLALADSGEDPVPVEALARNQSLPRKFLEAILRDLRRAGIVRSHRGSEGGYVLSRPAEEIMLGAVLRAVDGPLAEVRGLRPDQTEYEGVATHLPEVWVAVRASLRHVLDETSLRHVLTGDLPGHVRELVDEPGAWAPR